MVAPIRNIANKFFRIDSSTEQVPVSNFEVRRRIPTSAVNLSRKSLMASSDHSTPYHNRMDINIDCSSTIRKLTPKLFYETEQENALQVSVIR